MTKDDIIAMVREAGFVHWEYFPVDYQNKLERFAALIAAASASVEREACAKVCEREYDNWDNERPLRICASAIRARSGEKK